MATRQEIIDKIRRRARSIDEVGVRLERELRQLIDTYLDMLRPALGDALDEPEVRRELRREVVELAFSEALTNNEILDAAQQTILDETDGTNPIAYLYLGPDDRITRPFCDVLEGTWLRKEEISRLDNQQVPGVFVSRGGYNCRHQWHPLYDPEELDAFPHGDVNRANSAAQRDR